MRALRHVVYTWVGLKDYLRESRQPGSAAQLRAKTGLQELPMRAVGGFLGVVALALAAKIGMSQMTPGNAGAYLWAGGFLLALVALWFLALVPARWLFRAWGFVRMLHSRGRLLCENSQSVLAPPSP